MLGERSKKALEKRGLGIGVWRKFALGANWREAFEHECSILPLGKQSTGCKRV